MAVFSYGPQLAAKGDGSISLGSHTVLRSLDPANRGRIDPRTSSATYPVTAGIANLRREFDVEVLLTELKSLVRTIPDYPKPGILFRDVTTLLGDAQGFKAAIAQMAEPWRNRPVDSVAGIEARGFILGGAIADRLGCGFIPIRKKGKLPWKTIGQDYALEYGVDVIEMHEDACHEGERILIVDDLIATGGTAEAAVKLIRRSKGEVLGATFIIDLPDLGGMAKLAALGVTAQALMAFEGH